MKSKDDIMSGYKAIFEDGYRAGRASVVLPHPCDGPLYKDCTAADYFAKMAEEHLEVIEAYKEIEKNGGDSRHFLKECTDLIIMTTSLMNSLGCDEKMRQQYMKEINESNAKRDGGKRFASSKKDFTDSEKESLFSDREIFAIKKGDTDNDKLKKQDDIIEHPAHYHTRHRVHGLHREPQTQLRAGQYHQVGDTRWAERCVKGSRGFREGTLVS